jgi:hypothetical protein
MRTPRSTETAEMWRERYSKGNVAETIDPVTTTSSFTLNDRFRPPGPGVRLGIPFGLPLLQRVGNILLGARLAGRQAAFACYAGTQTEDIDATYDTGLPMPIALLPVSIDNSAFSYRSTYRIKERTLKIHREFTSHVPGQVCAPEVEEQLAGDLNAVRIDANTSYAFAPIAPPVSNAGGPPQTIELKRAMIAGQRLRLDFLYSLNVDCSSMGFANVRIVEPPQHGKAVSSTEPA